MARKKAGKKPISQEDNAQAQQLLARFHAIAERLHKSSSGAEVEIALHDIYDMPESVQIALLKALSREQDVDAADILQAVYELGPVKAVRKEARRCLIALEASRIYPQWSWSAGRIPATSFIPDSLADIILDEDEEDDDEEIVSSDMSAEEVLTNFLESLTWGTHKLAYALLASDSSLRNGLSRDEWVSLHRSWVEEAEPQGYREGFQRELSSEQAAIDLPVALNGEDVEAGFIAPNRKQFEVGWSMSMSGTALNDTTRATARVAPTIPAMASSGSRPGVPELPLATAINQETRRHWFWATHTLVQEQDEWRIESMNDEVAKARNLSIAELQERVQQHGRYLDDFSKQYSPLDLDEYSLKPDEFAALEEARWRSGHVLAYYDALIEQEPRELAHYELAAARSLALKDFERSLVYFDLILERFPERRDETLLQLGGIQIKFIRDLQDRLDVFEYEDELINHIRERAEANLRESMTLNDTYMGHLLLAQLLKDDDQRLDEVEEQLQQAKALAPDADTAAMAESEMGTLAMEREDYEQALEHYQHVAEVQPDSPKVWADIADAYNGMEQFEEAEASYRRAIELKPDDTNLYVGLGTIYLANEQMDRSRELWEEGLRANPNSAEFRYYLAMILAEQGEFRRAQTLLEEAEEIDPDSEMAFMIDQMLNAFKTTKLPAVSPDEQAPVETTVVPERKQLSGVKPPMKFSRPKARKRKKK
ncbi:MAG TPA: tetratricopeptide repeat protein [Ktedonobacteraceae bacterium]|nr:tetratricopeptide repeat protein [Ktedonobacteraceae bacterium]